MPALLFCSRLLLLGIFALVILSRKLRGGRGLGRSRGLRGRWGLGCSCWLLGCWSLRRSRSLTLHRLLRLRRHLLIHRLLRNLKPLLVLLGLLVTVGPHWCSCIGSTNATDEHRRNDEQHHRDHATDQKTHNSSGDRPAEGTAQFSGVVAVAQSNDARNQADNLAKHIPQAQTHH